jgi:hypothetical protein
MSERALDLLFALAHFVYCMTMRQASHYLCPWDKDFHLIGPLLDELLRADPKRPFIEKQLLSKFPPPITLLRTPSPIDLLNRNEVTAESAPIRRQINRLSGFPRISKDPEPPPPSPKEIVKLLKKDRQPTGLKTFPIIRATERGADLVGGVPGRFSKPDQLWHDLNAAELTVAEALYPRHFQYNELTGFHIHPGFGDGLRPSVPRDHWRGEGWLVAHRLSVGGYVPDAAIVREGQIVTAVEMGSAEYDEARIEEIITACDSTEITTPGERTKTPYAIW